MPDPFRTVVGVESDRDRDRDRDVPPLRLSAVSADDERLRVIMVMPGVYDRARWRPDIILGRDPALLLLLLFVLAAVESTLTPVPPPRIGRMVGSGNRCRCWIFTTRDMISSPLGII